MLRPGNVTLRKEADIIHTTKDMVYDSVEMQLVSPSLLLTFLTISKLAGLRPLKGNNWFSTIAIWPLLLPLPALQM